jgi:hypothetical protein
MSAPFIVPLHFVRLDYVKVLPRLVHLDFVLD